MFDRFLNTLKILITNSSGWDKNRNWWNTTEELNTKEKTENGTAIPLKDKKDFHSLPASNYEISALLGVP